ncbi:LPS export ABC transporter periplasmic protein LptC [Candidatus Nitrosoglobus terrae]|uniref:LPS export ABC transporter periplasmic protein LptC n=1 Tax=Candidatus Nitrosoglobus terrae TaxID=1630141 RepID=UPI001E2E635A|nr:LPS export ABC transporter periplasmic protein LptC [Candidatus Nitrosoglobus terrae]
MTSVNSLWKLKALSKRYWRVIIKSARTWGIVALVLIATLTAWELLREEPTSQPSLNIDSNSRTIDYFMEQFISTVIDQKGLLLYQLSGAYMAHYPDNDTIDITAPHMLFYHQVATPSWDVIAERGLTNSNGDEIYLLGKVIIHQLKDSSQTSHMKILTRDVRVEPAAKYAETQQPATLLDNYGRTDGIGARIYFKEERVEILSQVRGDYAAADKP